MKVKFMSAKIEIRNVTKIFRRADGGSMTALENVSADIAPGEFVSLLGASGCGKSTLLRLIAGLDATTRGEIFCNGEPITGPDPKRGLVFQEHTLFPWMTVYGNIAFALKAAKQYKEKRSEIEGWIAFAGISGFAGSYPHALSGGMRQRAALVRALVVAPDALLLDEPLGALDSFTRMALQDELIRLWQERKNTMVMVTHDVDEAIYLSQRIIVMSPRPGSVSEVLTVPMSYPRNRASGDFEELRALILKRMDFAREVQEDYLI
jgi:ABC-type nitrate/sulfonate/bicarbonate transport system ATPase subunit